jgi:hypothetical protein
MAERFPPLMDCLGLGVVWPAWDPKSENVIPGVKTINMMGSLTTGEDVEAPHLTFAFALKRFSRSEYGKVWLGRGLKRLPKILIRDRLSVRIGKEPVPIDDQVAFVFLVYEMFCVGGDYRVAFPFANALTDDQLPFCSIHKMHPHFKSHGVLGLVERALLLNGDFLGVSKSFRLIGRAT